MHTYGVNIGAAAKHTHTYAVHVDFCNRPNVCKKCWLSFPFLTGCSIASTAMESKKGDGK